jgi:hypothetical protein
MSSEPTLESQHWRGMRNPFNIIIFEFQIHLGGNILLYQRQGKLVTNQIHLNISHWRLFFQRSICLARGIKIATTMRN